MGASQKFDENKSDMILAINASLTNGDNAFFSWFNKAETMKESFIRGSWDFSYYFVTPEVCCYLKKPEEKNCLEIGYGAGRLLHASRRHFKHSYGVGLHSSADRVKEMLLRMDPSEDFTLLTLDDVKLPLPESAIHYVYSFIVIQHFYSRLIFEEYVRQLSSIVAPGGLLNLYFADVQKHHAKFCRKYLAGIWKGYIEESAPPDSRTAYNTLWMSRRWVKRTLKEAGFEVLCFSNSYKNIPDGYPSRPGSQSGVLARKVSS